MTKNLYRLLLAYLVGKQQEYTYSNSPMAGNIYTEYMNELDQIYNASNTKVL